MSITKKLLIRMSKKPQIHYLCFYAEEDLFESLICFPSALPKIDYVANTLKNSGRNICIYSTCQSKGKKFFSHINDRINKDNIPCSFVSSLNSRFSIINKISTLYIWLQIICYIFIRVRKEDTVLLYHSCFYFWPIRTTRFLKKYKLVIEVEELYYSLFKDNYINKQNEIRYLQYADSYLLVNDLLKDKIGIEDQKKIIISYGSYKRILFDITKQPNFNNIHVVYAGVIESVRKAAFLAVESIELLTDKYTLHVLGFGNEADVLLLKSRILETNQKCGYEKVIFHGSMYGSIFSDFLATCHIGLSCHTYTEETPESADCTFPSKVLVYLSHNLRVVSLPLKCLEISSVSELISFSADETSVSLADAILKVNTDVEYNSIEIVKNLNNKFIRNLNLIFN